MKNYRNIIPILCLCLILIGCTTGVKDNTQPLDNNGWKKDAQVLKAIEKINFTFPSNGLAFENKEQYVKECFDAIKTNSEIIELTRFNDTINIRFFSSREESGVYTGQKSSGSAWPHIKTLYVVANENQKPPIKHELMHLITMLKWGYPSPTSTWMNEGLGTYAENNCNNLNVAQIYRYFLENDKLIPIDLLTSDFYNQPEMLGYHQSAYIVEYLLENYTIDQFKRLWTNGFDDFESIYGVPYSVVKAALEKSVMEAYPIAPEINFEKFTEGCN